MGIKGYKNIPTFTNREIVNKNEAVNRFNVGISFTDKYENYYFACVLLGNPCDNSLVMDVYSTDKSLFPNYFVSKKINLGTTKLIKENYENIPVKI